MSKEFYKFVKSELGENELILDGVIASESWYEDEVSPKLFREELEKHTGNLTVRINSPGGDVYAGMAIHNYIREYNGNVTVKVDGIAASAAAFISMAGDNIVMLPGSMMMVHQASTFAMGNKEDLKGTIEMLRVADESQVSIFSSRTGQTEEKIRELLKAETWMTAQEAVDLGFADEAIEPKTSLSQAIAKVRDYADDMKSAVMQPIMSIQAKAAIKAEQVEETYVTDTTKDVVEDDTKESETTSDKEVETETTEVTETVDEETKEPVTEKETVMTEKEKQDKAAAQQVLEPKAQANPNEQPKVTVQAYLQTKESMEAFAKILEENPAADLKDKTSAQRVRAAWKEHLEVKAGVTNPEIFLPQPLITEIEDAFKQGGEIWQRVSKTGMDSFNAAWDANSDPDAESGRAKGYNREEEEEKAEQQITINNRILRPQFVYKYITLNREDVKEQRSTGALVRFVLSELPKRIIREVERAIVIGDGRAPGSDYKIQEGNPRGFYPVKADAGTVGSPFATTYTPVAGQTVYETLRRARSLVKADGGVILVAKEGLLLDMEFEQNANGGFLFAPGSDLSRYIKVDAVVEPDWMEGDENDAYIFAYNYYRVVGDLSVEAFQNFLLKTNKNEYLQEIWAGGGLTALKSAVAVASTTS